MKKLEFIKSRMVHTEDKVREDEEGDQDWTTKCLQDALRPWLLGELLPHYCMCSCLEITELPI